MVPAASQPFLPTVDSWPFKVALPIWCPATATEWLISSWWMWTSKRALAALAFGLIAGGGLSNAIDRVVHGAVVDNFQFHYGGYEWYVFNLADVWICAGVIGVLLVWLTERPENAVDG